MLHKLKMKIRLKYIDVNFFKEFPSRRPRNILFSHYKPFPRQRDCSRDRFLFPGHACTVPKRSLFMFLDLKNYCTCVPQLNDKWIVSCCCLLVAYIMKPKCMFIHIEFFSYPPLGNFSSSILEFQLTNFHSSWNFHLRLS